MKFQDHSRDVEYIDAVLQNSTYDSFRTVDVIRINSGKVLEISVLAPDRPVTMDDCEGITRILQAHEDFMKKYGEETILSVASPGLERNLKTEHELSIYTGHEVRVVHKQEKRTEKTVGILTKGKKGSFSLKTDEGELDLDSDSVKSIRLTAGF